MSIAGPLSGNRYQGHFLQMQLASNTPIKIDPLPEVTVPKPSAPEEKTVVIPQVLQKPDPVAAPVYHPIPTETFASAPVVVRPTKQQSSSSSVSSSSSFSSESLHTAAVIAFEKAIYPISKAPNWGAMRSANEWDRIYAEMNAADFVEIPAYNMSELTIPMSELTKNLTKENIATLTAKLFYSTRFFGRYHLDSGEFEGVHTGIDFKLAPGTPIGSIAGGVVHATGTDDAFGNYVMVLHTLPTTGQEVVSLYGHLEAISVSEGQTVRPGSLLGTAGSTGRSESAHLHLQVDWKKTHGIHVPYAPSSPVSQSEAQKYTIHPIEFIQQW